MKKINKLLISLGLIGASLLGINGVLAKTSDLNHPSNFYNPEYYSVKAPSDYYANVNLKLTGEAFRNNLYETISKGHTIIDYHDNNEIIRYTDPAKDNSGRVVGLYSGELLMEREKDWNKEHVWAKSHGFPNENQAPHGDAHHLRPAIPKINSKRSNHDFGECNAKPDDYGNKCDGKVFEPRDEAKGDVARMMFYMATRYGAMTPYNLRLVESRTASGAAFGGLNDLIKWHYEDPVSKEEIYRNNIIFEYYQHNRNPYIDHPEWVDLAYPSKYANEEVDSAKVNKVINLIDNLPLEITLANKDLVNSVNNEYSLLNYAERLKVTNYDKLLAAINKINELENPNPKPNPNPDQPVIPSENDLWLDLSDTSLNNQGYTKKYSFKVDNYNFYASAGMVNSGAFRLGSSMNDLLSIFNLNEDGAYLDILHDFKNVKSISINISKTYSGYNGWKLFFKEANSDTFELINEGNSLKAEATLANPRDGHFVLAIIGSKARADLGDYIIKLLEKEDVDDSSALSFAKEITESSVRVNIKNNKADIDLRFGVRIKEESYDPKAKYGVLVLEGNKSLASGLQDVSSISDITLNKALEITPVRVNANGIKDDNGKYYQFAWVITNMETHYDFMFNAVAYMEINGKLYFSKPVKASLKDTSKYYIDNNLVNDPVIEKLLKDILK